MAKKVENSRLFYFLLFLSCLNVNEMGSLIFIILCICAVIRLNMKVPVDNLNYPLVTALFCISAIVSSLAWGENAALKCFNYLGAYVVGYSFYINAYDKAGLIKRVTFTVFLGYSLQVVLVYLNNLYRGQPSARTLYAIWHSGLISVTLIALLSSIVIGYSFYAIVVNQKKNLKVLSIIVLLITAIANITTATRTPFLLFLIVFPFLYYSYLKNSKKINKQKIILVSLIMLLLLISCYCFNWFGVKTYILNSALFERFGAEGLSTGRIRIAGEFISYMLEYPFGGGFARQEIHNFAHNILQEVYDMYGAIPFIIVLIFYFQGIRNTVYVLKFGRDIDCNYIFAGLYIAIMMQMLLEPVIEGFPIMFYTFLLLHGLCTGYIKTGGLGVISHEDSGD